VGREPEQDEDGAGDGHAGSDQAAGLQAVEQACLGRVDEVGGRGGAAVVGELL
jgi:hypothetical protein